MSELNDTYTQLWLLWLLGFAVIEGMALARKSKGDTLTEHVRQWFALKTKPAGYKLRRGFLAVFLLWLIYHFFFE